MSKTNLTVSIEKDLLRSIKIIAAENDTSISGLVTELLQARAKQSGQYERSKKRAKARMKKGWDLGFTPGPREALYER
jgi:uncharacterized protein DUF6364